MSHDLNNSVQETLRRNKFREEDWKLVEDSDGSLEDPDSADEAAAATVKKNGAKKMSKKKKGRKSTSSTLSSAAD